MLDLAAAAGMVDLGDETDVMATTADVGEQRFAPKPRAEAPAGKSGFKSRAARKASAAGPGPSATAEEAPAAPVAPSPHSADVAEEPSELNAANATPNPTPVATTAPKPQLGQLPAKPTPKPKTAKPDDGSAAKLKSFVTDLKAGGVSWAKRAP